MGKHKNPRKIAPAIDRAQKFIAENPETGCWDWTGYIDQDGYGQFWHKGNRRYRAHRFAYEHYVGQIPEGHQIDHLCRNRSCVNPGHLEAVTPEVNKIRGMSFCAQNSRKNECKHGHEFTPENTYTPPGTTWRYCATCKANNARRSAARLRDNQPASTGRDAAA